MTRLAFWAIVIILVLPVMVFGLTRAVLITAWWLIHDFMKERR